MHAYLEMFQTDPGGSRGFSLTQAIEMGRPARLRLTVDVAQDAINAIRVAGSAIKIADGMIRTP